MALIPFLGRALEIAALAFAAAGATAGVRAALTGSRSTWSLTRGLGFGFAGSMIAANLLMIWALVTHDFSVSYVAHVGSRSTPTLYTIISLWASLEGSILFWGGILGVYVAALLLAYPKQHREYMPWTVAVLLGVSVFFAWLVAGVANPFEPTPLPLPTDGPGPNALLQNHPLMALHPPMLYLGYVGMAVPFSMGCAALFAGRLEAGWIVPLRRWSLFPWTFLTIGVVLGGWWSYEVLGWGGYWAWDPVENASFHPWLTATAFLHSALLLQRRGTLRAWSIVLLMATFLLTLLGTFMTRSGVFNSVHSFTQSSIGPIFLVFIALCSVFCLVLLAFRLDAITRDDRPVEAVPSDPLGAGQWFMRWLLGVSHPLSREFAIVMQNFAFAAFTFAVLFGTLYPLLAEAWDGRRVSVGEPYFDRFALPIGLLIVLLMGIGPALPWGRARGLARLAAPLVGGVAFAAVFAAFGFTKPATIAALFTCGFALVANVREFWEPVFARAGGQREPLLVATAKVFARGRRRFGGHVAHVGVVLAVVAIALSKGYKVEHDFALAKGQSFELAGFRGTYTGARLIPEPQRDSLVATFEVTRDGRPVTRQEPRLNFYRSQREPIGTPAVYSTPAGDLYFSLLQVDDDGANASLRALWMPGVPWLWVSLGVITLGSVIVLWPSRRAASPATAEGAVAGRSAA